MATAFWRYFNRLRAAVHSPWGHSFPRKAKRPRLLLERLEDRTMPATFTPGDIAVLQLAGTGNNTTGTIVQLAPSGANQNINNLLTVPILATGANALRFSDSGTSSFLSDTNDGALLVLSGYNTTDSTDSNLASTSTLNDRAVATLDNSTNFTLQTTYTGISGNQTRSATSLDDSNWYITDKGGLYTNNATATSLNPAVNILNTRAFGGTVYVSSASQTTGVSAVSTLSGPTASALTALPGLPTGSSADKTIQDFYLVQSGHNGSTYDVLYTLDQGAPTGSTAQINKFFLNGSTWQSEGTYALKNAGGTAISATSMIAENNGSGGVNLYVVTTAQAAGNAVVEYTDTAAYNASITVNGANSVTLYTASPSGIPRPSRASPSASTASTAATVSSPTSSSVAATTATLGGTVTDTGGQSITGYGIVYSQTSVNSNPIAGGTGVSGTLPAPVSSPFTVSVTGLSPGTEYSYAAYATNSVGTTYTSVGTFTTAVDTPTINAGSPITLGENHAAYSTTLTGINDGESDGNANVTRVVASVTGGSSSSSPLVPR